MTIERPNMPDMGHHKLVDDVTDLMKNIGDYQYHDFKNSTFPAPKLALIQKLEWLILNAKNGKYDND